ncbi:DUF5817 domain-containing protein [Halorussus halobius]|uniref:DUF5817 domain-containing protein n=1 Tax=Halorussus halobius TaxID=1710537 RepID=UPI0010931EB6|nr:DUF5817 domain-containing protein [Halorussus halobius]
MTWQVVGCSTCHGFWLAEDVREQDSTECPLCFAQHATDRLNVRFEHDDHAVAAEIRSRILAEHAGEREAYEAEDDYGQLADRIDDRLQFREEYLADAANSAFEDYDQLLDDEAEAALERWSARFEFLESAAMDAFSEIYGRFEAEADDVFREQDTRLADHVDLQGDYSGVDHDDPDSLGTTGELSLTRQQPVDPDASTTLDKPISGLASGVAEGLRDQLVNAIRTLAQGRSPLELQALLEDAGLTASSEDADLLGLADKIARGSQQAAWEFVRALTQPSGRAAISDRHLVPAVFALVDATPTVTVRLDDAFHDQRRSQREDVCEFLAALAQGCDVRLVGSGVQQLALYRDHRESLPVSREDITPLAESQSDRVANAKEALDRDGREVRILRWLAAEDSQTLAYSELYARSGVGKSRVRQAIRRLAPDREDSSVDALGLVDTFGPNANKHVELLPAGEQYLDWLDDETARQRTLDDAVSDVCNGSDDSRVSTRAHVGGEDRHRLPPLHTTQRLPRWDATATAATPPANGIAVVDYPLAEQGDQGAPRWAYREATDTLVVGAEATNPMQYWVCIARALASRRTFSQILEDGDRIDGTDDLGEFLSGHKPILRDLVCMGYLPDDVEDGSEYVDELEAAEEHLCELTKSLVAGDYEGPVEEFRSTITREAMGLAKTMLDLLDLCGVDVVQQVRLPRQNGGRHESLRDDNRGMLVKLLATAVKLQARANLASVYRQLFEQDGDRREAAIDPSLDAFEVGDLVGAICVVGDLGDAEADLVRELKGRLGRLDDEVHEDAPDIPVRVPVEATDDLSRQRFGRVVERMAARKNLRATRAAVSLLRVFVATPFDAARAIAGLRSEADERDLRVSEVREALAQLAAGRIMPWETRGVRAVVAALLAADQPLSGMAVAERADVARRTWQTHKDWLLGLGLVSETEQGYRLTVAFNTDDERYADERRPWFVKDNEDGDLPFPVLVRSLGHTLATRLLDSEERSEYFAAFRSGTGVDVAVVVERWPRVERWLDVFRALGGAEAAVPTPVVFGQSAGQQSLRSAVAGGGGA